MTGSVGRGEFSRKEHEKGGFQTRALYTQAQNRNISRKARKERQGKN
jgi:hypothetical protein